MGVLCREKRTLNSIFGLRKIAVVVRIYSGGGVLRGSLSFYESIPLLIYGRGWCEVDVRLLFAGLRAIKDNSEKAISISCAEYIIQNTTVNGFSQHYCY